MAAEGNSALKAHFAKEFDKMMALKLPKLKKLARVRDVPDEAVEASLGGVEDEDSAKEILIGLIFKAACLKLAPSPARAPPPQVDDFESQTCQICKACIRPPGHDGLCMDGQCNDILPEREDVVTADMGAEHAAKHLEVKGEIQRRLEQRRLEAAQAEEALKKAEEERVAAEAHALRLAAEAAEEEERRRAEEEAARFRAEEEERQRHRDEAMVEIAREEAAMATLCVETFLGCIRHSNRIRTPLKGTILYTKFIRPARPVGTSVDVKDSTFSNLGNYLKFLEHEGLLALQPGLTDPVVTWIDAAACARYKYSPPAAPR